MPAILLVEPNIPFRRMMEQLLRQAGHEVWGADDAETAGKHLKDREFDAVVVELKLPGSMPGTEFLEWLRDMPPPGDPARVALSSVSAFANQEAYLRAELALDGFLVKPFKPSQFKTIVEHALEERASRPKRDWRTESAPAIPASELQTSDVAPLDTNPGLAATPAPSSQEFESASDADTISLEELSADAPAQERRAVPRYAVRLPCAVHDGKNPFRARTENLASGGGFIATDRQLPAGSTVRVRLELPVQGSGFNEIVCEVVHGVSAMGTMAGFGVKFREMNEETAARLATFLEDMRKPAENRPFLVVSSSSLAAQVEAIGQQFRGDEVRVRLVKRGEDVREAAENEPPDLILVDLADPMLVAHIGALKSTRATSRIPVGLVDFTRTPQAALVAAAAAADKFFVLPDDAERLVEFSAEVLNASRRRSVRVKYQRPIGVVRPGGREERGAGVDLSETGLQVRLAQAPPEKSAVEVVLRLSDGGEPVRVKATVAWATPADDGAELAMRVGLLLEPDEAARSRIREEVRRALTASYYVRWLSRAPKAAPSRPAAAP